MNRGLHRSTHPRTRTIRCSDLVGVLSLVVALGAAPRLTWAQQQSDRAGWEVLGGDDAETKQKVEGLMRTGIKEY